MSRIALKSTGFGRRGLAIQLRETHNAASPPCGSLLVDVTVIADTATVHYCAQRMQSVFRMRMARRRFLEVRVCVFQLLAPGFRPQLDGHPSCAVCSVRPAHSCVSWSENVSMHCVVLCCAGMDGWQAKAARALASGGFLAAVRRGGTDSEEAERAAAVMMQCAWRGRRARQEMKAQKHACTLIQVCGAPVYLLGGRGCGGRVALLCVGSWCASACLHLGRGRSVDGMQHHRGAECH